MRHVKLSPAIWVITWAVVAIVFWLLSLGASMQFVASIAFFATVIVIWRSIILQGLVSGGTAFLVLFALFHIGVVIPVFLFGTSPPIIVSWVNWLDASNLTRAVSLSVVGLLCAQAGLELGQAHSSRLKYTKLLYQPNESAMLWKLWLYFALICFLFYLLLGFHHGLFSASRTTLMSIAHTGNTRWFGAMQKGAILGGFLSLAFAPRKWVWISGLVTVLPPCLLFFMGTRGDTIVTLAAVLIVVHLKGIRIPRIVVVLGIIFILALIPVMRHLRGGSNYSSDIFLDPVYEMGSQIQTVLFSYNVIDHHLTSWWMGKSYWNAFVNTIPNVGGIVQPVLGGSRTDSTSYFFTRIFSPGTVNLERGTGYGSSIVAEAYLNFGIIGVMLIPAFVGYWITRSKVLSFRSLSWLAFHGIFLRSMFWMVRNDSLAVVQATMWGILLLGGTYLISRYSLYLRRTRASANYTTKPAAFLRGSFNPSNYN